MKLGGYVDLNKQLHLGGTLMAKGRKLPFTITGDMKNPKLTVGWKGALKEAAAPVVNQLKDKAFDALNKEVAEILKQAKEKADLMRANGDFEGVEGFLVYLQDCGELGLGHAQGGADCADPA